ncbi:MAG TPA: MbtH family NRPS accessory protein [Bryobacteraceae bacterium]|nr:MbtH family NRPS accessory protein [Bryobacteraceae bacterium]HOL71546.1 MbtH family NRPS accessory protein [Bryobacteraceae bacterium]HOQ46691.1 MbtH family NRPS accessory protein [Bryobacteraceae bacterium]HPQ16859.1 MbtH family NRPS accessory protein [Bryobacteraceae bacterium]HPU72361.1 MbtH family NRPS accessory protein [Bryobacteraceae bacterium]
MAWESLPDDFKFLVLVNGEEQYSLWRGDVPVPGGWSVVKEGTREECLQFVDAAWQDMRPRSLRQRIEEAVL